MINVSLGDDDIPVYRYVPTYLRGNVISSNEILGLAMNMEIAQLGKLTMKIIQNTASSLDSTHFLTNIGN